MMEMAVPLTTRPDQIQVLDGNGDLAHPVYAGPIDPWGHPTGQ